MLVRNRLEALGHIIAEICKVSGIPGISLGVLHKGEVIYQANFGFRDVSAQLSPNENTTYVLGSLTKAVTSAMVGILVEDGKLDWTTQLHDAIPEFQRDENDPASNITISDLLTHRTGLPAYDALWIFSNNRIPLERSQAVPILSYVPVAKPLRTEFIYNNMAYEVAGQVIEKLSGVNYSTFLQDRILGPLGMTRTFYTNAPLNAENFAKPYATLRDASPFELPPPLHGEDIMMGAAGGIRSSVKDLLVLYKAFMEAGNWQIGQGTSPNPRNPLKQFAHLWQGMMNMPFPSLREHSYASGWVRAQLPAVMGFDRDLATNPMVGQGFSSRLALYHQGTIPGFMTYSALFPETSSAVVVLSNSVALNDGVRFVGQLLIEELFGNSINATEYIKFADITAKKGASIMSNIRKELVRGKTVNKPTHSAHAYIGRYYNSIGNFFIDILQQKDQLRLSFMGLDSDSFDLEPYQHDSFFWHMTHNKCVKRARVTEFPKEYYIIKFGCHNTSHEEGEHSNGNSNVEMNCLCWKHEGMLPGDGEVFQKSWKDIHVQNQVPQKLFSKLCELTIGVRWYQTLFSLFNIC